MRRKKREKDEGKRRWVGATWGWLHLLLRRRE